MQRRTTSTGSSHWPNESISRSLGSPGGNHSGYAAPMRRTTATEAVTRYRVEADMLAPLARRADTLLTGAEVLFEIPCTAGVPDLALLDIDREAVAARVGTAPLLEPVDVRVMLALQSTTMRPLTTNALSEATVVSRAHMLRTVLPRLVDGGHVEAADGGWRSVYPWRSLARKVVTVEVKLRDWRRGLAQAIRHTAVADEAWLVLDAHTSRPAQSHADWFTTYGVGLGSLSVDGDLTRLVPPNVNRSRQPNRELLIERAVCLHLQGSISGPVPQVFGSVQLASTGDDPRLQGAVGRSAQQAVRLRQQR